MCNFKRLESKKYATDIFFLISEMRDNGTRTMVIRRKRAACCLAVLQELNFEILELEGTACRPGFR